ncbi:hypothetical protein [Trinickia sp.]|uniref:hypothetical protein n=1 Tax=Trinickia sp. TaxID=2571163 RepID=UPI003F807A68
MIDITQDNTSSGAAALARSDRDGDLGDGPRAELQADQGPEASLPERVASPRDAAVADARTRFDAIVASTRQALGRLKANAENGARGIPTLQWMTEPQSDEGEGEAAPELDALAHQLAIVAYNNRDNAIWDPLDPSTYRSEADEDSALLRVLSMAPEDATPTDAADETLPAEQTDETEPAAFAPGLRLLI